MWNFRVCAGYQPHEHIYGPRLLREMSATSIETDMDK